MDEGRHRIALDLLLRPADDVAEPLVDHQHVAVDVTMEDPHHGLREDDGEPALAGLQRGFHLPPLGDVKDRPHIAEKDPIRREPRLSGVQHPGEGPVRAPQAILHLNRLVIPAVDLEVGRHPLPIVRMQGIEPAEAEGLGLALAGRLGPQAVVHDRRATGVGHPDHDRRIVGHGTEAGIAVPQRLECVAQLGNVGDARHDEALLAVALPNDGAGLPHEQGADTAGSVRPLFLELARLARAEDFSIDLTRRKRAAVGGQAALRLAGQLPRPLPNRSYAASLM